MSDVVAKEVYRYTEVVFAPPLDEFEAPIGKPRVELRLETFKMLRPTPCGVWIDNDGDEKFISLRSKKRFACPTKVEALESFLARKARQYLILTSQLDRVTTAERLASVMLEKEKEHEHAATV